MDLPISENRIQKESGPEASGWKAIIQDSGIRNLAWKNRRLLGESDFWVIPSPRGLD